MNGIPTFVSNDTFHRSNTHFIYHDYNKQIKKMQTKQGSSSKNSSTKYRKTNTKSFNAKSTFLSNSVIIQKPEFCNNILVTHNNELRVDYFGIPIKKGKPHYHHISFIDLIDINKSFVSEHLIQSYKIEDKNNKKKYIKNLNANNGNNKQCCCTIY
jgi:hypothetical protein